MLVTLASVLELLLRDLVMGGVIRWWRTNTHTTGSPLWHSLAHSDCLHWAGCS